MSNAQHHRRNHENTSSQLLDLLPTLLFLLITQSRNLVTAQILFHFYDTGIPQ